MSLPPKEKAIYQNNMLHYPFVIPCMNCQYYRFISTNKPATLAQCKKSVKYATCMDVPCCHFSLDTGLPKDISPVDNECKYFMKREELVK